MEEKLEIYFSDYNQNKFLISYNCLKTLESVTNSRIIEKIEEGCTNIAILVSSNTDGNLYVLIIHKNNDCDNFVSPGAKLITEMQEKGEINTDNIVQIYGIFVIEDVSLTDDPRHCPEMKNKDLIFQIEEYINGITLDEKIFNISKLSIDDKLNFLIALKNKIEELLQYVKEKGLYYDDLQSSNFMLRNSDDLNTLTFIDIDSFKTRTEGIKIWETDDKLDSRIKRNLSLDMYGPILEPMTVDERNAKHYKTYRENFKIKAKLFARHEIGEAFGMIIGNDFI